MLRTVMPPVNEGTGSVVVSRQHPGTRLRVLERVEDLEVERRDREWHPPKAIAGAVVEEILRT
jgi:hypothetical protein